MTHQHKSFAILGLGTFGSTVAAELVRFGNHVLGIDMDENRVSRMANTLSEAIIADGRDDLALRETGIGHYDVVVIAMGEDLEASILCTMNARILGAKTIWVKASSRTHPVSFPNWGLTVSSTRKRKWGNTLRRCCITRWCAITLASATVST